MPHNIKPQHTTEQTPKQRTKNTESNISSAKRTPMLEQYLHIKAEHTDCLLFYRMGDFYELFFEDAIIAARELQITLTNRHKDSDNPMPMCGVPWHSAKPYISQLIAKGFHVAICEQIEKPQQGKGIVRREVTQIITPSTVLEDDNLESKSHTYLAALYWNDKNQQGGLAWVDTSTGFWSGISSKKTIELWQWAQKIVPKELLLPEGEKVPQGLLLDGVQIIYGAVRTHFNLEINVHRILEVQEVRALDALGLDTMPELTCACGALLVYLNQVQRCDIRHLQAFSPFDLQKHLIIDALTERNLEIFTRLNGRKGIGTLWHILDATLTPMGGRFLEDRLRHPWRDKSMILKQQDAVTFFHTYQDVCQALREALKTIYDLERISTRIHLNRSNPRDFISLRNSLAALQHIPIALTMHADNNIPLPHTIHELLAHWDNLTDCTELLQKSFVDSPPNVVTDGGLFKQGYDAELDILLDLVEHGEQKLQALLAKEQTDTGFAKLKLGYNRVFGYYFELSKAGQADKSRTIPEHFIRRQSLANTERFTTVSLKELEEDILNAAEKRKSHEYQLFQKLRETIYSQRSRILLTAHTIAQLDYWQSLATVAQKNYWSAPTFTDAQELVIREGRHPVVESIVGVSNFVPNDFSLDQHRRICLLTGPNMAGKSTVLRQTAIICILAHMGSYVPASYTQIGIVDRIFSRVGASDNLAEGQSTFMVEMMETARILRQSTKKSLVILDEIGRGTSTYDGLALAWAVVEELQKRSQGQGRTLFATHYHELTALEGKLPHVFTMNIAIAEHSDNILFLHRLVPGPADRSYGVEVARLAGVPMRVVQRARELLASFERLGTARDSQKILPNLLPGIEKNCTDAQSKQRHSTRSHTSDAPPELPHIQKPSTHEEHPLITILKECEPERMSPMDALKRLTEWKLLWGHND